MTIDKLFEPDVVKVKLLDNAIKRFGVDAYFVHELKADLVYTPDRLTPLFKGMKGVPAGYNITSVYFSLQDAEEHMGLENGK